jgi:hypothetical protein
MRAGAYVPALFVVLPPLQAIAFVAGQQGLFCPYVAAGDVIAGVRAVAIYDAHANPWRHGR